MLRFLVFCELLCIVWSISPSSSAVTPTKGGVWPKPQKIKKKNTFFTFRPNKFQFTVIGNNCLILEKAMERYTMSLWRLQTIVDQEQKRHEAWSGGNNIKFMYRRYKATGNTAKPGLNLGVIQQLLINLLEPCEQYPYLGMVENYTLKVSEDSVLTSSSIWGILRGLETFTQLFYITDSFDEVRVNMTSIVDYPRYPHRGLMLDTSQHFISVDNILLTLDAMAMNKLNVFHWQMVGDPSFPYHSDEYPDLSELGAFHYSMIYSKTDIELIIETARMRGIRVIPQIGIPGHASSWGKAYPNILTECLQIKGTTLTMTTGLMNPIREKTYDIVGTLLREVQALFTDKYMHIGGETTDDMRCWTSNPEIVTFMATNNITGIKDLYQYFIIHIILLLREDVFIIFWQDILDYDVPIPVQFPIQIWKDTWINDTVRILSRGQAVILSSPWFLDDPTNTIKKMYSADPQQMLKPLIDALSTNETDILEYLLGGEAVMLGENVGDTNIMSRVWPRASAVAEVLWSSKTQRLVTVDETQIVKLRPYHARLEEHACRMLRQGIGVEPPGGPSFCLL